MEQYWSSFVASRFLVSDADHRKNGKDQRLISMLITISSIFAILLPHVAKGNQDMELKVHIVIVCDCD